MKRCFGRVHVLDKPFNKLTNLVPDLAYPFDWLALRIIQTPIPRY